jgi:hypothetical protein
MLLDRWEADVRRKVVSLPLASHHSDYIYDDLLLIVRVDGWVRRGYEKGEDTTG